MDPTPANAPGFDIWMAKLSGVVGSLVSLRFIAGTWPERFTMALGGSALSLYSSTYVAERTGLPEGLSGFLLGLFGMAIAAKVWEAIQATQAADVLARFLPGKEK